jgi:hypothetical protein
MSTVDVQVTVKLRGRAKLPQEPAPPRMPRITRLMALAIKFQDMVDRGEVRDYADIARLGYVTRARVTQIMNLVNLAPDIQEALLFRPERLESEGLTERAIRIVVAEVLWPNQRHWLTRASGNREG